MVTVDFGGWYVDRYRSVVASCVAMCGDVDVARDAADEAFSRAFDRWSTVSVMASPEGWVCTVAMNCLRRSLRWRTRERVWFQGQREPIVTAGLPNPDLWAAVRALPTRQRTAIVLRYVTDLPEAEIAVVMGIARGTVAATLATARARLSSRLAEVLIPEDDRA